MKVLQQYDFKNVHGETVKRITVQVKSKEEAKQIGSCLGKFYRCLVTMQTAPAILFDENTGRECPGEGLYCYFSIFPDRKSKNLDTTN